MNAQPLYKHVAFFLLTRAPRVTLTTVSQTMLSERMATLPLPAETLYFGDVAQDDVDEFHQCLAYATSNASPRGWREQWIQAETQYLATKLRYYYAHLDAICKAENVYLKKTRTGWEIKFPWEQRPATLAAGEDLVQHMAERAFAPLHDEARARQHVAPQLRAARVVVP